MNAAAIAQWIAQHCSAGAHLASDSRAVFAGDVFFAYPGERVDGRSYIRAAVAAGAAAVVVEEAGFDAAQCKDVPYLAVPDLKRVAGEIAAHFYGHPSRHMQVIGVTGTNGKTTCTQWLAHCLSAAGTKCAVIGTLGIGFPGAMSSTGFTTPQAVELQRQLASLRAEGAQGCAIEVSSIGLCEHRLAGMHFAVAAFTNLTRDHLDYHGTQEAYEAAKRSLFGWPELADVVINLDDAAGRRIAAQLHAAALRPRIWATSMTTSQGENADTLVGASGLQWQGRSAHFELTHEGAQLDVKLPALGDYNVANALTVAGCLLALRMPIHAVAAALATVPAVAGRMNALGGEDTPLAVVDYAHTPDALASALNALRPVAHDRKGKLICVFGCGGDRDPGKRPQMGQIAAELADRVVVTSDNPRSEAPQNIIDQILAGIDRPGALHVDADRARAIAYAVDSAHANDVVLLAGKGHESVQEIAGVKHPFDDATHARQALDAWRSTHMHAEGAA
ncbi:MAG: UDP-N-acetylmuramoylalanyl-D-glutamate-2,6-diami no-pimelate ligase [Pseudomonadota bacterium]|jgi:UDP-N-acetylmuramyl-tripeptide synthetase